MDVGLVLRPFLLCQFVLRLFFGGGGFERLPPIYTTS